MSVEKQQSMTPEQALAELREGNERFLKGTMAERDLMAQVRAAAVGQHPFAAVLACSDSRVPPELIFDQGIGDIFCSRIAGNFVNTDILGSLEFATKLAGAKLIVVLGHTRCGAIRGACDKVRLGNLSQTLSNLTPAVNAAMAVPGEKSSKNEAFVQEVTEHNVRLSVDALTKRSAIMRDLIRGNQLQVVGAIYDIDTGRVSFFD